MKPKGKANLVHQKILSSLIETRPTSWEHKRIDPDSPDPKKPNLIKTKIAGFELRHPLAQHVSAPNIEIAARRWAP